MSIEPAFYTDKDVARRFSMSPSWVRGQRHKRKTGQDHVLTLSPRFIGSCPRYVRAEVEALVSQLMGE